jgi:hypothetical protein
MMLVRFGPDTTRKLHSAPLTRSLRSSPGGTCCFFVFVGAASFLDGFAWLESEEDSAVCTSSTHACQVQFHFFSYLPPLCSVTPLTANFREFSAARSRHQSCLRIVPPPSIQNLNNLPVIHAQPMIAGSSFVRGLAGGLATCSKSSGYLHLSGIADAVLTPAAHSGGPNYKILDIYKNVNPCIATKS